MKNVLGLLFSLVATPAFAQSVETEMNQLKVRTDSCIASSQAKQHCERTAECIEFQRYSKALMPEGLPGYYDAHLRDKTMNPENGKGVSAAAKAKIQADKLIEQCAAS
ncbi:hypothetical protein LRQ11_21635 [Pseudomonas sp. MAFF 311095]|uniref:PsiF repeat-containing protein n=1 Tax=Pseudomonas petroselini TaxID=2899822 RepID=A0ABS8R1U5_9PSED|nr:hypothetical protein [Pseudomonas petroselini]MCD7041647.1 hypothetical protein [Pseudomonas petroselini]MCD7043294.1 hypothetical protein [Pseudomonas petroselini]MCD7067092.1 hypothetical protein [Pseudomonas petroselini]MCD7081273.1 hypothetical protein [Pseudomonas petroselini]